MALQTSLFDIDNWREIGATLARNKTRTFLTAFGIFWGTMMLSLLWGGSNGLEGLLMRNFAGLDTNMAGLFTSRTSKPYKGFNKARRWNLDQNDLDNIRSNVEDVDKATGVYQSWGQMSFGDKSSNGQIIGIEPDYLRMNSVILKSGRLINESDLAGSRKVAVIGDKVADQIFPGIEYSDVAGRDISLRGVYYKIVGVAKQIGEASVAGRIDDSALIPLSTMRQVESGSGNRIDVILVSPKPGVKVKELLPRIRRQVYPIHSIHPADEEALDCFDLCEIFEMVSNMFLGLTLLSIFVGFGSLMAGIIGVGNIMWIIVRERTHEIGIRRAIGARPSSIIIQILSESMVLTTIAGLAGIVFSTIVLHIIDMATAEPGLPACGFTLTFSNAMIVLATFMILGTAAGVLPAIKAMRIKPIEAINDK